MPIRGEGLVADSTTTTTADDQDATAMDIGRTVYVLHPNCAVEEM